MTRDFSEYRYATIADAHLLATMNQQLIRDEGHRNSMTLEALTERMQVWLRGEWQAVLFLHDQQVSGYTLYRDEVEWVYLRQFFIRTRFRRMGRGFAAIQWLKQNAWKDADRIRLDVLGLSI